MGNVTRRIEVSMDAPRMGRVGVRKDAHSEHLYLSFNEAELGAALSNFEIIVHNLKVLLKVIRGDFSSPPHGFDEGPVQEVNPPDQAPTPTHYALCSVSSPGDGCSSILPRCTCPTCRNGIRRIVEEGGGSFTAPDTTLREDLKDLYGGMGVSAPVEG